MQHYPTINHNPRSVLDEATWCHSSRWPAYLSTYDEDTHANQFSDTPQRPSLFPAQQGRFLSMGAKGVKTECGVTSEAARSNCHAPLQASAPTPVGRLSPSKSTAPHFEKMDSFGDAICSSIAPPPLPTALRVRSRLEPPSAARAEKEAKRTCLALHIEPMQ